MGWLKRAASSVKNAMGFGDDSDDEAYGENGEKNNSSRRRSNHSGSSSSESKEKVLRYPVLQFAQSPITGEFIGGVQGLSWFCESFREMVKGMSPTRFFEKTIRRKGRFRNRVGG
ncbi:unnamed protein product [Bathycoccus prasinos]